MESDENNPSSGTYQLAMSFDYGDDASQTTQGSYSSFYSDDLQKGFQSALNFAMNIQKQAESNHDLMNQDLITLFSKIDDRCSKAEQLISDKVNEMEQNIKNIKLHIYETADVYKKKLNDLKEKYNSIVDQVNKLTDATSQITYIQEESLKTHKSLQELSTRVDLRDSLPKEKTELEKTEQEFTSIEKHDLYQEINKLQKHIDDLNKKYQEFDKIIPLNQEIYQEQQIIKEQTNEIKIKYDCNMNKLEEIEKMITKNYQQEFTENKNEIEKILKSIKNLHSQQENLNKNEETHSIKVEELNGNMNDFQLQIQNLNEQLLQIKQQQENQENVKTNSQSQNEIEKIKIKLQDLQKFHKEANLKLSNYIKFLKPVLIKVDQNWLDPLTSLLISASKNGHTHLVSLYMDLGANVNARELDKTPLHYAAASGFETIVRMLIKNEATIDSKDNYCNTPLHFAAEKGHQSVVMELLFHKANKDGRNNFNETPLHKAAEKGHLGVVSELLKQGANINCKNNGGKTALDLASIKGYSDIITLIKKQKSL